MTGAVDPVPAIPDRLSLRILATTDLHMHVLPYNYLSDRPSSTVGLARTATLIETRRAERPNTLLLDNGDFLQGSALGDFVASQPLPDGRTPHPAIAAMNALRYDAATLGNHDFNYGLTFLRRALDQAAFPFTVANAKFRRWSSLPRWLLLDRDLTTADGRTTRLRIGVIGFLPPLTPVWEDDLSGQMTCDDILTAARREVPLLRAAGADLVVALAHSGIGSPDPHLMSDDAATALAGVPGIDAIVAGHTHQVFPSASFPASEGVDPQRGTLLGKPAVMAGYGGSHLGIIDLDLTRAAPDAPWSVAGFEVRAEAVNGALPSMAGISQPAMPLHRAALRHFRRRIGRTEQPLNSFFSLVGDDPALRLVQRAQRWHVRRELRDTEWEGLPILSAASPFRAGGRGGPSHYTHVPAGTLTLRSLSDIYLFPNRIRAIVLNGAQLAEWLERSAGLFHRLAPDSCDARLINPAFPSYNFDVIDGVTWEIDLTAAPPFCEAGLPLNPGSRRIRDLRHLGRPVEPGDRFVMATNSYRVSACGLYGPVARQAQVVLDGRVLTRDVLRRYIARNRSLNMVPERSWRFVPLNGASALFATSPEALAHLPQDSALRIEPVGWECEGFAIMRIHL